MAEDQRGDEGKKSAGKPIFSEETVEQIKRTILGIEGGVGYKHPPQHTRFKKGQSGNPKGRPKKLHLVDDSRSANSLILKEAERPVSIREGEETREIPAIEAAVRAQLWTATKKGNAYAQKHFIERYDEAERKRRAEIAERIELWELYVEIKRAEIAEAKAKGEPLPLPLPHPDDVIIDYEEGVRFIGPMNEEGAARLWETIAFRGALLLQDALDRRLFDKQDSDDPLDGPGTALVFAQCLNNSVPERFRLSDIEMIMKMERYSGIPKRVLLKEVFSAWRAINPKARRGKTFPPVRYAKAVLEFLDECIANLGRQLPST